MSNSLSINFEWLPHGDGLDLPCYLTEHSAGMDLQAAISENEPLSLSPHQTLLVPCGFALALPNGYEGQVRPRSGLAFKHNISVLNAPGTIDADYRGEIKVLLHNYGADHFEIIRGMRIAQLVIAPVIQAQFQIVETLSSTDRGQGGFGSTGH